MAKPKLRFVVPTTVNRTVGPRRPKNADLRTREHLTDGEVEKLIEATKDSRARMRRQRFEEAEKLKPGEIKARIVDLGATPIKLRVRIGGR